MTEEGLSLIAVSDVCHMASRSPIAWSFVASAIEWLGSVVVAATSVELLLVCTVSCDGAACCAVLYHRQPR